MRILALVLSCLVVAPAAAKDITVTATQVPLNPEDAKQTTVDSLEFVAGFALDSTAPEWGGYSGMVLSADGSSLLAVSDVGHWLRLELQHDDAGQLIGVGGARIEPLLDEAGQPVAGKEWSDAEEIALLQKRHAAPEAERRFVVAFERRHRLWSYTSVDGLPDGPAQPIALPDGVQSLPENSGLEAVRTTKRGQLYLIAEGGADPMSGSRGWWSTETGEWTGFAVERSDGFEPTAFGQSPGPEVLLLERRYTENDGPAARISLLTPTFTKSSRLSGFTLAVLRRPLTVDNFEAMAVQRALDRRVYIYLLSDDNQSDQQRTLLLQFRTDLD